MTVGRDSDIATFIVFFAASSSSLSLLHHFVVRCRCVVVIVVVVVVAVVVASQSFSPHTHVDSHWSWKKTSPRSCSHDQSWCIKEVEFVEKDLRGVGDDGGWMDVWHA